MISEWLGFILATWYLIPGLIIMYHVRNWWIIDGKLVEIKNRVIQE